MNYSHIVFDIDGTLIDTEYAVLNSLQETIRVFLGKDMPCSELTFALGITGIDALKILDIKDVSRAIRFWETNMRRYADTVKVFDGINGLLEKLFGLNRKMGIVTSRTRDEFEHDFCRFGIRHYFITVVCADDTKEHKPSAAPLLKYAEAAGIGREKILYVGDSEYDSKCAENAGVDFALAGWGSHGRHIKADYFLERPDDLLSG